MKGQTAATPGTASPIDAVPSPRYYKNELQGPSGRKIYPVRTGLAPDSNGQDYLITKVYSEVFTQYAVLRPAEVTAPDAPAVKVKVAKGAESISLPGFTFTQEGSF